MIAMTAARNWRSDKCLAVTAFELFGARPVVGRRESRLLARPVAPTANGNRVKLNIVESQYFVD